MTTETLQKMYDDLGRDRIPEQRIFGSPQWIDLLKKMPMEPAKQFDYCGIKVVEHPAFPIKLSYPACDVATKEEIIVNEYIHAAIFPYPITVESEMPPIRYHVNQEDDKIIVHCNRNIRFFK